MPRYCLASFLLLATLPAQAPSPWSALQVQNGVALPTLTSLGKLIAYRDGTTLHVWSAVARRWTSTQVTSAVQLRLTNDCLLAMDAGTWQAFSSYTGRFAPLSVSPAAVLTNGAANNNDSVLLVADNGALHAFSGFVGDWTTRSMAPNALVTVTRHVGVLAQSGLVSAIDSFTGQWTDLPTAAAISQVSADGTAAFADDGTTVFAFSAVRRTWSQATLPANRSFARGDDWGVWYTPTTMLGYSSLRDQFQTAASGASAVAANQDVFALFHTASGPMSFSALSGSFGGPWAPTGTTLTSGGAVALFSDPNSVIAYSPVLDTTTPLARNTVSAGCAGATAFATDSVTGRPILYGAFTGTWTDAPANVLAADPLLTTTAAAMATPTGMVTFNARTGNFVPLQRPGVNFTGNPSSSPLVAYDANDLLAFDARNERWVATPRSGTGTPTVLVWRTATMVLDGNDAFGFGVQAGSWSRQPMPEPLVAWRANSESGRLHTATWVLGHSAVGEVVAQAQFPEFRRVQALGAELQLAVAAPPAGLAVLGLGSLASSPINVPGLGDLWLTNLVATVGLAANPSGDPVRLSLPLPQNPALRGYTFAFQAAMLPATGTPWLTDATTVMAL